MNINDLKNIYHKKSITYEEAEQILYNFDRNIRFEIFIALYDVTLKNDLNTAYKVFREAYCSSDNIFKQIQNSTLKFNLKSFLNFIKNNNVDFIDLMSDSEKKYYNKLPNSFKIYRGISQNEHETIDYGISWSLSEKTAENYVYFNKNEVKKDDGAIIDMIVEKKDILTVFSVHGDVEIIYIYTK